MIMSLSSLFSTSYSKLTEREQKITFFVLIALLGLGLDRLFIYTEQALADQQLKLVQQKETYKSLNEIHTHLNQQIVNLHNHAEQHQDSASQAQLSQLEYEMTQKIQHMAARHHLNTVIKKILDRSTQLSLEKLNSLKPLPLKSQDTPASTSQQTQTRDQASERTMKAADIHPQTQVIKNGLHIALTGHYLDILKFIEQIEQINEQIFWNKFEYKVTQHPKAQVLLDIYSLSINKEISQIEQTY